MTGIRLGYACVNTRLPSSSRSCRLKNATPERLEALIAENLTNLRTILQWNADHGIYLFRISSDIIPFGSHPVNSLPWWDIFAADLQVTGDFIRDQGMRVSMHPGQYTVLNSDREAVVASSLAELDYHARFLQSLGLGSAHKIILHVGGTYGDKPASLERFIERCRSLPEAVHSRMVVENDEKSFSLADVLQVSERAGVPAVFDVFHHIWNPSLDNLPLETLVDRAAATWGTADGRPKLHYSDQWPGKAPGAHSQSVDSSAFQQFYEQIRGRSLDVMLETKDKEQSVLALYEAIPDLRPRHGRTAS